jgi:hypothetical protein
MAENGNHDSGPHGGRTQVQRLAAYAHRAQFGDLSPESVRQLPVHVLTAWPAAWRRPAPRPSTPAARRCRTSPGQGRAR